MTENNKKLWRPSSSVQLFELAALPPCRHDETTAKRHRPNNELKLSVCLYPRSLFGPLALFTSCLTLFALQPCILSVCLAIAYVLRHKLTNQFIRELLLFRVITTTTTPPPQGSLPVHQTRRLYGVSYLFQRSAPPVHTKAYAARKLVF